MFNFQTSPEHYKHWDLRVSGSVAELTLDVKEDETFVDGYTLKLNSYDLGVDIELADAIQRMRFEHPEVRVVVITSRITSRRNFTFSAGANIYMLAKSEHGFKVNFCKFTNETRCYIEDDSKHSGRRYIAALNGATSGGGYELALACDEIYLLDDGNSTVALPEVPSLGVLPGTGGLTRLVDKRGVRRDRADHFSTSAKGMKGELAKKWKLIDDYFPMSQFTHKIDERIKEILEGQAISESGIELAPLQIESDWPQNSRKYKYVRVQPRNSGSVDLTLLAPEDPQPADPKAIQEMGAAYWPLQAYRELDDALLHLRLNEPRVGVVALRTQGTIETILSIDKTLNDYRDHWLIREIRLFMARVLRRLDLTAKSFFAIIEPESCFAGNLLELLLAADQSFMLKDPATSIAVSELNADAFPMSNGLTRLESRFLGEPDLLKRVLTEKKSYSTAEAESDGLITFAVERVYWDDKIRVNIGRRLSYSPDALTGMEASLRFAGPETMETKIFGRLTAWQNWIFQRPNATGEKGALTSYGKPDPRPHFDFNRT
jgi:benzoyl-CoA-dihydrodiol lyase